MMNAGSYSSRSSLFYSIYFSLSSKNESGTERVVHGARRKFQISRVNKGFECRRVTLCNKIHDKVILYDLNIWLRYIEKRKELLISL